MPFLSLFLYAVKIIAVKLTKYIILC